MPSHEAAIVAEARRLARAQEKRRRVRRLLKEIDGEIRMARKNLRALASGARDPMDQSPPLRMFGETKTG